jgi:hypothetical protein
VARPFRAIDTLLMIERRGAITAAMREADEDFRQKSAMARSLLESGAAELVKGRSSKNG